jgi:hypothetical protein
MRLATLFTALASGTSTVVFDPELAQTLAYFAASAYCNSTSIKQWSCPHCSSVANVVEVSVVDAVALGSSVQAFVAKLSGGGVVVSYRGTESNHGLADWIVDAAFIKKNISASNCAGCEVHEGFFHGYSVLQPGIAAALSAYDALHAPFVNVTGHSLGAAMAEIAVFNLLTAGWQSLLQCNRSHASFALRVFTYPLSFVQLLNRFSCCFVVLLRYPSSWKPRLGRSLCRSSLF